jgi:hypothetical protein
MAHMTTGENHEIMPENRALLLDYLQNQCKKFFFRRETYYLCQNYVDLFMEQERVQIEGLKLLGITCLYLAMKFEEVDLVPLREILLAHPEISNG